MRAIRLLPALLVGLVLTSSGAAQSLRSEALNVRLVGHHDLQARSAYQPVIHRQGDRFGLHIVEPTGPARGGS